MHPETENALSNTESKSNSITKLSLVARKQSGSILGHTHMLTYFLAPDPHGTARGST